MGTLQGNKVVKASVERIVDEFIKRFEKAFESINPAIAKELQAMLKNLHAPDLAEEDEKVEKMNKKALKTAGVIVVGVIMTCGLATCIEIPFRKDKQLLLRSNLFKALVAAMCSCLAEFNFLSKVVTNYQPTSNADVATILANELTRQ